MNSLRNLYAAVFFKGLKAGLVGVALVLSTANASAVVINFDELATNTLVNNVYPGVTFGTNTGDGNVRVFSNCCSQSDPNSIAPSPGGAGTFNFNGDLIVQFASAVNGLSFFSGGDNDVGTVALIDVFGLGGVLLGTQNLIADGDGLGLTEELQNLGGFANVTMIHIRNVTDAAGLVYDTFTFSASVPEPGSLALVGLAFLALGLGRRRRTTH